MWKIFAKSACDMRRAQRMRLARAICRAGVRLAGSRSSRGLASGSRRAAASTSSSVMALSSAHISGVMPFSSVVEPLLRLPVRLVVFVLLTFGCLPGRDDALAVATLNIAHGQERVADQPSQQEAVLVGFVGVEAFDKPRIPECKAGSLECHTVLASIELRLRIVPFEFVMLHPMLVDREVSKRQAPTISRPRIADKLATPAGLTALRRSKLLARRRGSTQRRDSNREPAAAGCT